MQTGPLPDQILKQLQLIGRSWYADACQQAPLTLTLTLASCPNTMRRPSGIASGILTCSRARPLQGGTLGWTTACAGELFWYVCADDIGGGASRTCMLHCAKLCKPSLAWHGSPGF